MPARPAKVGTTLADFLGLARTAVVASSPRPGTSLAELLRSELQQDAAMLHAALGQVANQDQRRANLTKAAAARAGMLEERLREIGALLPREPGRPRLEETSESFLQKVKMLRGARLGQAENP